MVALPKPQSQVPGLIFAAYVAANEDWDGLGFSPSMLGSECDRFLYYAVRWAHTKEQFQGKQLRLFASGHYHEAKMVEDLRRAGLEIHEFDPDTGRQFTARALGGHLRGKLDGMVMGVPEAPATWHVFEAKSHGEKSWKALVGAQAKGGGVREGKFEHWVQMQVYMHIRGLDRALYGAVRKSDDDLYFERVNYDADFCTRLLARLERILGADEPPARICSKADDFKGQFCKAKPQCFGGSFARLNCRTCLHSTPRMDGDASWFCERWIKPLSPDEQREACPAHLYIPGLVPGEVLDADDAAETVSYRLHDGRMWTDGRDVADAPVAAEGISDDV